jgi:hypothetical protein
MGMVCIGLLPRAQAAVPAPDGGYPGFTMQKEPRPFKALLPALRTQQLVGFAISNAGRSFNTATGAGTLLSTPRTPIRAFGAAALLFNTTGK